MSEICKNCVDYFRRIGVDSDPNLSKDSRCVLLLKIKFEIEN